MNNFLLEICKHCGLTYGSHHAGISPWPRDYCPGHEGRMDWENGPGTVFEPTGIYKEKKEEIEVFCFSNGNTAVTKDGKQVLKLQQSWLTLYAAFLRSEGINLDKVTFVLPSNQKVQVFETTKGDFNWRLIDDK